MIRVGVDFGGTKIEAAAIDVAGAVVSRVRAPNPGAYEPALHMVADLVRQAESQAGGRGPVGVGMPGSVSPKTGLIRNANSVWLNDRPFAEDLSRVLARPVRLANDANCMALSEATDGAAAGASVVFGAILGTGCGGGVVVNGQLIEGVNGVAGEWGHIPLPWPTDQDKAPPCWCGRRGCLETYVSGPGLAADYQRATGKARTGRQVVDDARARDRWALAAFDRYVDRLARGLAVIVDILDPEVIVLGGGMSNVWELYERLPDAILSHIFSDLWEGRILKAAHGDSSGVRGAAWLWPLRGETAPVRETA